MLMNGVLCAIGATEIIVVCVLVLLLFGGKKIPELMKGLGQGVRNFKQGMNEPSPEEIERQRQAQQAMNEQQSMAQNEQLTNGGNTERQ